MPYEVKKAELEGDTIAVSFGLEGVTDVTSVENWGRESGENDNGFKNRVKRMSKEHLKVLNKTKGTKTDVTTDIINA